MIKHSQQIDVSLTDTIVSGERIHLNNAGASLSPRVVIDRVLAHLALEQRVGGYEAQDLVADELNDFYQQAAMLINAHTSEIAYCESATSAWQKFVSSIPLTKTDRVIVFAQEYASNFLTLLHRQRIDGFAIDVIPNAADGDICLDTFAQKMNHDVKVVLLAHMPSQSGQIADAALIGQIAKKHNALFVLDATQTIGQCPIDVAALQCDALCATGRKFLRGPRGTGFLYVSNAVAKNTVPYVVDLQSAQWLTPSTYKLHDGAERFETWECNIAAKLGLKEAMKYANQIGMEAIASRGQMLSRRLREGLSKVPGLTLCDPGKNLGNIITFTIDGMSCDHIVNQLAKHRITINTSLREYALIDFSQRGLEEVCRISPHYYNTPAQIDEAVCVIAAL